VLTPPLHFSRKFFVTKFIFYIDLLPFYAILRSIPNKLLGVIAMFSAILILLVMPYTDLGRTRGLQFRPFSKLAFFIFVANFLILMVLGAKHVESPFIEFGQISTVIYFAHFLIIVPLASILENSLIELSNGINNKIGTIQSACSHGVATGFCAFCFRHTHMKDCYHNWVYLPITKSHVNHGIMCDFGDTNHVAALTIDSLVKTCDICTAVLCSNCFG